MPLFLVRTMNYQLQYIVFDNTGSHVEEANVLIFDTLKEYEEGLEYAKKAYETEPIFDSKRLSLIGRTEKGLTNLMLTSRAR